MKQVSYNITILKISIFSENEKERTHVQKKQDFWIHKWLTVFYVKDMLK